MANGWPLEYGQPSQGATSLKKTAFPPEASSSSIRCGGSWTFLLPCWSVDWLGLAQAVLMSAEVLWYPEDIVWPDLCSLQSLCPSSSVVRGFVLAHSWRGQSIMVGSKRWWINALSFLLFIPSQTPVYRMVPHTFWVKLSTPVNLDNPPQTFPKACSLIF